MVSRRMEEQIAARKKEAKDKDIAYKAGSIAKYLGSAADAKGERHVYEANALKIDHLFGVISGSDGDMAFSHVIVTYQGAVVFKEEGYTLEAYIPGTWEAILENLALEAERARKKQANQERATEKKREKSADRAAAKSFGIKN